MLVQKILNIIFHTGRTRQLVRLFSFTVQSGLINLELTLNNFTVSRDFIASLQLNNIANHNLADMDFLQFAVTQHLGHFLGFLLRFQSRGLALLLALAN